jgi:4-deoxy-L-threo-5-hexosulose-uronate ketol-isomerase
MADQQPKLLYSPLARDVSSMPTDDLRAHFLIEKIFSPGQVSMTFTDLDRMAVLGIQPSGSAPLKLQNVKQTGADFFLQRREAGVINVGQPGTVTVDGKSYDMANLDGLYISMGSKDVTFSGDGAKFYVISTPAHAPHPTTHIPKANATPRPLGTQSTANVRKISQSIHQNGAKSCQLGMGFTDLADGSVWNTMPPHTHTRRTEIYFYFDIPGDNVVAHFLGAPQQSRHLWVKNEQVALSPDYSIHCGCGTSNYKFIWAMGGENQTFDDMDQVGKQELK